MYIKEYKNNVREHDLVWAGLGALEMGLAILPGVQQDSEL